MRALLWLLDHAPPVRPRPSSRRPGATCAIGWVVAVAVSISAPAPARAQLTWGSTLTGSTGGVPNSNRGVCQVCTTASAGGAQVPDNHWMTVCDVFPNNPNAACAALAQSSPPLMRFSNWLGGGRPDASTDVVIGLNAGETSLRPQGNALVILSGIANARTVQSMAPIRITSDTGGLFLHSTTQSSTIEGLRLEDGGQLSSSKEVVIGGPNAPAGGNSLTNGVLTRGLGLPGQPQPSTRIVIRSPFRIHGDPPDPFAKAGIFVSQLENQSRIDQGGDYSTLLDTQFINADGGTWKIETSGATFGGTNERFENRSGATLRVLGATPDTADTMVIPVMNQAGATMDIVGGKIVLQCPVTGFALPGMPPPPACARNELQSGSTLQVSPLGAMELSGGVSGFSDPSTLFHASSALVDVDGELVNRGEYLLGGPDRTVMLGDLGTFRNPLPDEGAFAPKVRVLQNVIAEIAPTYDSTSVTQVQRNAALTLMGAVVQLPADVLTAGVWEVDTLGLLRMPGRSIRVIGQQATVILRPDSVFEPLGALQRIEPGGGLFLNGQLQPPGSFQNNGRLFIGSSGGVVLPAGSNLTNAGVLGGPAAGGFQASRLPGSRQAATTAGTQVSADLVENTGTVHPGGEAETGVLRLDAAFAQSPGGVLAIEIAGPMLGSEHDQLEVSGAATLGGRLEVALLGDALNQIDGADVLVALAGGSLAGVFENVASGARLATQGGEGSFVVSYGAGSAFPASQVVLSQFVPEPSALLALLAGCLGLGWRARRGRGRP